ncbi:unnamed protein product [Brassica rapa subsp. narinosa]
MKAAVVTRKSSTEVNGELRYVNVAILCPPHHHDLRPQIYLRRINFIFKPCSSSIPKYVSVKRQHRRDGAARELRCRRPQTASSTLIHSHDEAKSGTALFPLLSFFHTEIAYDSFTARRESLVGATMVNF